MAFCNEQGKLSGLPINFAATVAWYEVLKAKEIKIRDYLVGNIAVVFGDKEFMEQV